jgi:uncharacterized membrane protein
MASPVRFDPEEEQRIELGLALLLRAGVIVAAVLVLLGGILYLRQDGGLHPDYARFSGEPSNLQHPLSVLAEALALQPLGLIQLGVLVLLATPVVRVAVSLLAFAKERDRIFVGMTAVVLTILLLSLFGILP